MPEQAAPKLAGLSLLLVDDDPDVLEVLQLLLETEDAIVTAFCEPHEALEWAKDATADVVISDVGMPGMNGHELVRALHALPVWHSAPAIALTGFGEANDPLADHASPFTHRLSKPVAFDALVDTLVGIRQRSG